MADRKLRITQKKSAIGRNKIQKRTIEALGIKRLNHTVVHNDTAAIRGMINRVSHLIEVEEVEE